MTGEGTLTPMVVVALLGWIPAALAIYCLLPPRKAMIASFVIGWLFLPISDGLKLADGIPQWDKVSAIVFMAVLCTLIFDSARVFSFRLKWFDLPILAYTFVPIASSLSNGATFYEGICASFKTAILWFAPYFLGRIYFTDLEALQDLGIGIVAGALGYVPLCLIESWISPQLHLYVYGYHQHAFAQTYRLGGWRPMVFMQHGLAVGMFMTEGAILAVWMAVSRSGRTIIGWSLPWIALLIVFTALICRSSLAIGMLLVGLAVLVIGLAGNTRIGLIALVLVAPVYILTRSAGVLDTKPLIRLLSEYTDQDRGTSMAVRMKNEDLLVGRALEHPEFGWGYSGRFLVRNDEGEIISVPDGFWVIALGENGIAGLALIVTAILLPAVLFMVRFPPRAWAHPLVAPAAAMAVVVTAHMIDNLANAMLSPLFVLPMGALGSVYLATRRGPAVQPVARIAESAQPAAPSTAFPEVTRCT